jgi:hypothetical protein
LTTDIWKRLEAFVADDAGKPPFGQLHLTRDTDLYHDLDMTTAHIKRFLDQWAATFHVDMASFDLHFYYPPDKLGLGSFFATIVKSPFSVAARETLGGRSLTLGMLEDAMRLGRWENPRA